VPKRKLFSCNALRMSGGSRIIASCVFLDLPFPDAEDRTAAETAPLRTVTSESVRTYEENVCSLKCKYSRSENSFPDDKISKNYS
jgi:hypothetical protein